MAMRTDCKYYETRTYASGEVVRMCRIDLAPEAPWRCPENCPGFERKVMDAGWAAGSLAAPMASEPIEPHIDESAASLLDSAESIINQVGPDIIGEVQRERARMEAERPGLFKRLLSKKRKKR